KLPFAAPAVAVGDVYFRIWAPDGLSAVQNRDTSGRISPSLARIYHPVSANANRHSCRDPDLPPLPHILSWLEPDPPHNRWMPITSLHPCRASRKPRSCGSALHVDAVKA